MDFKKVLSLLSTQFEQHGISYALIGGFALGLRGIHRATLDIDFLIRRDDLPKAKTILTQYGYRCVYETENVSQYVSDLRPMGAIDCIHAFRPISLEMLKNAEKKPVFGGTVEINVVIPEDIIGLKVQAIANNPQRRHIDIPDIQNLLDVHSKEIDWNKLKRYFSMFEMEDEFEEFRTRFE